MKHGLIALFAMVVGLGLAMNDAEAKRLGGGASSGMQRSMPAKRDAAPSQNTAPAQNTARPAQGAQASGASRWLGPIAGIAAGIGLAALISHLGLSEEFATILLMLLIAAAVFFVIKFLFRRMQPQAQRVQYAGGPATAPGAHQRSVSGMGRASEAVASSAYANIPADFDAEAFLRHAKLNFVRLQAANDAGDIEDIRKFTTPEMYAEIKLQMQERGDTPQKTEVLSLHAELLDVTTEFREHIASVRFYGTVRDNPSVPTESFDEMWHITKPADDSRNWAIAGIQQSS